MILSMTGFGKASAEIANKKIIVEVKSLNSKQIDLSTRISGMYREKEIELRKLITQRLERGKIEFALYIDKSNKPSSTQINESVVMDYHRQLSDISSRMGVEPTKDWLSVLLRMPDVLKTEAEELDENEWEDIKISINAALDKLIDFRIQEGKSLAKVFEAKIESIRQLAQEVSKYEAERIEKVRARLEENLEAISEKVDYDRNRLEQELIFYIEKLDVNEEKIRLQNHLDYFIETMNNEDNSGKKLGFITQEIGREINTLGSKANHSEMQKLVVLMKDELEQIKEQILNVL